MRGVAMEFTTQPDRPRALSSANRRFAPDDAFELSRLPEVQRPILSGRVRRAWATRHNPPHP